MDLLLRRVEEGEGGCSLCSEYWESEEEGGRKRSSGLALDGSKPSGEGICESLLEVWMSGAGESR